MQSAKVRIKFIVKEYIRLFPGEFEAFKDGMNAVRAMASDDFATLKGTVYTRALYEMPETLQTMLVKGLTDEEMIWLKSGVNSNPNQGGHWFAKTFPPFCIPRKI